MAHDFENVWAYNIGDVVTNNSTTNKTRIVFNLLSTIKKNSGIGTQFDPYLIS